MAAFKGTKGDHRKPTSINRTMRGQGSTTAKGAWERQIEASRGGKPQTPIEKSLEAARTMANPKGD